MKRLALLLVLANIVFFGWRYLYPPTVPAAPAATDPGVEELRLLSERGTGTSSATGTAPARGAPLAAARMAGGERAEAAIEAAPCFSAGPFGAPEDADAVGKRLSGRVTGVQQRSVEIREPSGYRVYIPPLASREAAEELAQQLADRGVTDYLIVITDELQNAISLGVFMNEAAAEQRRRDVAGLGFDAKLEQRFITRTEYWLDYKELPGHPLPATFWDDIGAKMPHVGQVPRVCE